MTLKYNLLITFFFLVCATSVHVCPKPSRVCCFSHPNITGSSHYITVEVSQLSEIIKSLHLTHALQHSEVSFSLHGPACLEAGVKTQDQP